jgi:hypothetical protein
MMIDLCSHCRNANNGCPIYPTLRITYNCVEYFGKPELSSELFLKLKLQNVSQLYNIQAEPPLREPASPQ